MPLQQRLIEPVHVCRNTLPLDDNGTLSVDVPNELECVTNGTLANIIRQLSSLSKQAEDIFGSLVRESTSIAARTNSLQGRVDRLAIKVTQLDSNVEEVSLQDIHMRKAFKSSVVYDQQVVSRESIPAAIKEIYLMCDKPPPLDKLNPYREDGKDGLKFYTDANYFFDLWKQEMLKDTERLAHDKGRKLAHVKEGTEPNQPRQERKRHKKVRQPHNTREKYRMMATKDEFLDKTANYPHLPYGVTPRPNSHMGDMVDNHASNGYPVRPSSLELQSAYGSGQESGYLSSPTHHYPPPPPAYIEHPQSPSHGYPPPPYTVATPDQHGGGTSMGTPTRQLNRVATMVRPTQPPPAPPISSNSSSGTSTPTISANGTPSSGAGRYYRGSSHSRDNLPPPPPPPEGTIVNGGIGQSQFVISNEATQKATRGPNGSIPHTPTHAIQQGGSRHGTPTHHPHVVNNHSTSILIQHNREQTTPPPTVNVIVNQTQPTPENLDLPPPPPTPDKETAPSESQMPPSPPPPPPPANVAPPNGVVPPPPPPMPLPNQLPNGPVVTNGGTLSVSEGRVNELASLSSESASTSSSLSKGSENQESKGKGTTDARSDLLAAIREGIKLRRVEDIKQKEVEKAAPLHDVASILARRIAMEFSDSDSASYSDVDSDAWDDETEC